MREKIRARLKDIEIEKEIRVLYACESGSRAWGFPFLVEQVVDTPELRGEIGKLIEAKRRGEELDRGPRIALISTFIESELARLENKRFEREHDKIVAPVDEFNDLFRSALDEVWSSYLRKTTCVNCAGGFSCVAKGGEICYTMLGSQTETGLQCRVSGNPNTPLF